jgi:outer membrane protein assembly factor BamB
MRSTLAVLAAVTAIVTSSAEGPANWPQWRGPDLNGVSRETGLPRTWSQSDNIAWKLPTPSRTGSTPIVWGDTIFLNVATAEFSGNLELWAVDRRTRALAWKKPLGSGNTAGRKQNMSTPSPVTDGRTVWVMTGTGIVKAFDFTGKEKWVRDIQKDYGRFGIGFGYASSPLLLDGDLVVQVLHGLNTNDPSYVLRIDGATGTTEWKVERPTKAQLESPDAYTTPTVVRRGGAAAIVVTGGDVATGHDPATGKEIWRVDGLNPQNAPNYRLVASAVVSQGVVILPTRVEPMLAIEFANDNVRTPKPLWSFDQGPDIPTPVTDGSLVYVVRDNGTAFALDVKTGAVVYGPQRLPSGAYSGSPVLADGHVYVTNEDGLTSVYKAGPKFELVARNALNDYCLSSPAVSEGQIFIRTSGHLWAIGTRKK